MNIGLLETALVFWFVVAGSCGGTEMSKTYAKLKVSRSNHCSTLLNDKTVLLTGGISPDDKTIDTAEILDVGAGTSTPVTKQHLPRAGHRCVKLPNGQVLLIGGVGADKKPEARIEVFDHTTRSFSELARLMTARVYLQAVLLSNNQVLVTGGMDHEGRMLDTAELIDPAGRKVTKLETAMTVRRYQHEAQLLNDGLVLITGGGGEMKSRLSAELYDPGKRLFLGPITMNVERVIHTATVLDDGRVFTFSNGEGELYEPATRQFVRVRGRGGPNIRDGHTATLLSDGTVLILGGVIPEFSENLLGAPLIYDPKSNRYFDLRDDDPFVNRTEHAAVRLGDGTILFTGGRTIDALATDAIFIYDPARKDFRNLR